MATSYAATARHPIVRAPDGNASGGLSRRTPCLGRGSIRGVSNLFTGAVIFALVILSMILTLSVLFPGVGEKTMAGILIADSVVAVLVTIGIKFSRQKLIRTATWSHHCRSTNATAPRPIAAGPADAARADLADRAAPISYGRRRSCFGAHRPARDRRCMIGVSKYDTSAASGPHPTD
jgi:hypothetical protein